MVYLQVEYLADGVSFQLYKIQLQITRGSTKTVPKIWFVAEIFVVKPLEGVFAPVTEIKPNTFTPH